MSKAAHWVLGFLLVAIFLEVLAHIDPLDLDALTGRKPTLIYNASMLDDAFSAWTWPRNNRASRKQKTTNGYGFVSTPPIDREKLEGTIRIVFLGGSSTANNRLDDDKTWAWRTIDRLRERFPEQPIDFINAAHGGFGTFESYGRLWSRIRFFSPDIIVVYHGWNDMYYFMERDISRWRMPADDQGGWTTAEPKRSKVYEPLAIDRVIGFSQALTKIRLFFSEPLGDEAVPIKGKGRTWDSGEWRDWWPPREIAKQYRPENLEAFRGNIRLMKAAASLMDAELFVAKQATMVTAETHPRLKPRFHVERHGFDYDAHVEAFRDIYRVIDEEIAPERVIDATMLSGDRRVFRDHIHFVEKGADALSAVMADQLSHHVSELAQAHGP